MYNPLTYAFWVINMGNVSFSTQNHCFPWVLASWLSSIHLLEMNFFLLSTPTCHTSKVAFLNVDYRYELHFWSYLKAKYWIKAQKLAKSDNIVQIITFCMFFSFYSKFCLVKTKNEVQICNLHSKMPLLMCDKWGYSTKKYSSPETLLH